MSINEMDSKIKELRELRRMADELAAEMETIQDSIKAHMDAEGVDTINGTDWKVTYKAVTSSRLDANALKKALRSGTAVHQDHHSPPVLYRMMKTIIAIAGAVQLTRCIMALIEALEKPSAPPPTKARHREP